MSKTSFTRLFAAPLFGLVAAFATGAFAFAFTSGDLAFGFTAFEAGGFGVGFFALDLADARLPFERGGVGVFSSGSGSGSDSGSTSGSGVAASASASSISSSSTASSSSSESASSRCARACFSLLPSSYSHEATPSHISSSSSLESRSSYVFFALAPRPLFLRSPGLEVAVLKACFGFLVFEGVFFTFTGFSFFTVGVLEVLDFDSDLIFLVG